MGSKPDFDTIFIKEKAMGHAFLRIITSNTRGININVPKSEILPRGNGFFTSPSNKVLNLLRGRETPKLTLVGGHVHGLRVVGRKRLGWGRMAMK